MLMPIRCFSCGRPLAQHWEEFQDRAQKGEDRKKILDSFGVERYCCRSVFMGNVDLIDTAAQFKKLGK